MEFTYRQLGSANVFTVYRLGQAIGSVHRDSVDNTWFAFDFGGEYVGNAWERGEAAELLVMGRVPHRPAVMA